MMNRTNRVLLAVFFCFGWWVYSGPVMGAEAAKPGTSAAPKPAAKAPASTGGSTVSLLDAADSNTPPELQNQAVKVGAFGQIDLHVKELDLAKVLQLLSIQSNRNIIASRNVNGSVSADLYGVDFYEALDAILQPNGYGYREKGNFIYVFTAAELSKMQTEERKSISHLVRLNYITAQDASTFVTPLLSSAGAIAMSGKTTAGFSPSVGDGGANENAHPDTLVIRDYPENVKQILDVLKELDVRPKQVLIEATVLEAKLNEDNLWGVDWTILLDFDGAAFSQPLDTVKNLVGGYEKGTSGQALQTLTTTADQRDKAAFKLGLLSDNIQAFVHALDQVTDTTVLANPKVLVVNRHKADLKVVERLPYISTTTSDTTATQTVEFLDIGTQLTLRPFISDDGFIRLELKPSISSGDLKQVGTQFLPRTSAEELTTNVIVRNGQTVVLGGLFKESTTVGRKQVPGVGDLPVVGAAFKGQDDVVVRSEVMFLVTPTIIKDESLYAAADRAKNNIELARIGAREELLPWSRSKLTAAHLRDARKAFDAGQKDKALWSVNMALTLDPTFIEARRLKESLANEQARFGSDRSILKDAIDQMIDQKLKAGPVDSAPKAPAVKPTIAPPAPPAPPAPQAAVPADQAVIAPATDAVVPPDVTPAKEPVVDPPADDTTPADDADMMPQADDNPPAPDADNGADAPVN